MSITAKNTIRCYWVMSPRYMLDADYSSRETHDTLERFGIEDRVQRKGYRNKQLSKLISVCVAISWQREKSELWA